MLQQSTFMQLACHEWDYDPERVDHTLVSYWNLVCSRRPLVAVADAVYSAGSIAAMASAGYFSEKAGRKPIILTGVAVLLLSTFGITFANTYSIYVITRFLNSGCATTVFVASLTLLFEVSTNSRRLRHMAIALSFGVISAELWFVALRKLRVPWRQLQACILSPTLLMTSAFLVVHESPRWLLCKRKTLEAGALMLAAACKNGFSPSQAKMTTEKIVDDVERNRLLPTRDPAGAGFSDVRRHALVTSITHFSATFAFYAVLQSVVVLREAWAHFSASVTSVLWIVFVVAIINRIPRPQFTSGLFATLGVLGALMTLTREASAVHAVLAIVTKGCTGAVLFVNTVLILELFPTAIRCQAQCLTFACGRVAAVFAALLQVASDAGRQDVELLLMTGLAFASMLVLHYMPVSTKPPPTTEGSSKLPDRGVSLPAISSVAAMKETLEPVEYGKKKSERSRESPRRKHNRAPSRPTTPTRYRAASSTSPQGLPSQPFQVSGTVTPRNLQGSETTASLSRTPGSISPRHAN